MSDLIKVPSENTPQKRNPKGSIAKKGNQMQKAIKKHGLTGSIVLLVVLLAACLFLLKDSINIGANALKAVSYTHLTLPTMAVV